MIVRQMLGNSELSSSTTLGSPVMQPFMRNPVVWYLFLHVLLRDFARFGGFWYLREFDAIEVSSLFEGLPRTQRHSLTTARLVLNRDGTDGDGTG